METKRSYRRRLVGGYYCVFAARMSDERKAQFYDTIDAVVDAANNFDLEGYDVYWTRCVPRSGISE